MPSQPIDLHLGVPSPGLRSCLPGAIACSTTEIPAGSVSTALRSQISDETAGSSCRGPITNPGNPGTEFKLRGVGALDDEDEQRRAAADAIESFSGWRPRPTWLFLRVMLEDVTCIEWKIDGTASTC